MKLTAHFQLDEFTRSQTATRLGIDNTPPESVMVNLQRLAEALERIRSALGGKAIHITSGYRCPDLNARIGGSKTSAHMDGRAADFVVRGMTPLQAARKILAAGITLDQIIYEGDWVHVGIPRVAEPSRGDVLTARFDGGRVRYERGIVAA